MEKDEVTMSIYVLESLLIDLETEEDLYKVSYDRIRDKSKELFKRYKIEIRICKFCKQLSSCESKEDAIKIYDDFLEKKADGEVKYKEFFEVDFSEFDKGNITYSIKQNKMPTAIYDPEIANSILYKNYSGLKKISEKVIVNVIQLFEECFKKILTNFIYNKPEAYFYDKQIKYKDLIGKDFEKLKFELVEQTAEENMYDVLKTITKINEIHNLHLEKYKDIYEDFIEIYLRRNIIVHNNCTVNEQYLSQIPQKYKNIKIGEQLKCSEDYINHSISTIFNFVFLLYYCIGTTEEHISILNKTAFELLKKEKWKQAMFCYDLLSKIKTIDNENKTNFMINYYNAKKHVFGLTMVQDEIEKFDISGMSDMFVIAKNLLLENHKEVSEQLEDSYPKTYNSFIIQDWPIFCEYRKSKEYEEFRQKHIDDFENYKFTIQENDN